MELLAMKGYSTLPRSPELESHHQMYYSVITKTPHLLEMRVFHYLKRDTNSIF